MATHIFFMGTSASAIKEVCPSLPALIPFPSGRYWLNEATLVLFVEAGRQIARQIPAKTIIVIGRDALKTAPRHLRAKNS
jgi:hypothetical protein